MGSSFRDLIVWQRAVELAVAIYALTNSFPPSEQFGLTSQLRRSGISVASNIAEGFGRSTRGEYLQFLGHARGSNSEIETQLVIARALGFGTVSTLERAEQLCREVGKLNGALIKSLRS
jgi:four helix bundle protein